MPCPACGHDNRPGARFCDACGASLAPAPPPADRRQRITVLFADLAGSTAMQERLDPEAVRRIMGRWSATMRETVVTHGGTVDHVAGDGIVATWGVRAVREDDAWRGVQAAWAMRRELAVLNEELERRFAHRLRMRTGVHTGDVVVSGEGFLIGDTMNTAARLEQNAPEGEVLVGATTWRLVRDLARLEPVAPLAAKGKREPLPAWRLLSLEAPAPREALPFVGRRAELGALREAFAVSDAGRCRVAVVLGAPGLGKSRLAARFATELGDRARVVRGNCPAYGEGMTYLPVAEVVRDLAGIAEGDEPGERLAALLGPGETQIERVVAALGGILGSGGEAPAEEVFWALRTLMARAAAVRPLVVVLEDLHWAAPQLLDLVEHLEAWGEGARVLILALARPELRELRPALADRSRHAVIALEELDQTEAGQIVGALLDGGRLPTRITDAAAGNPLFLAELVRMLIDDDLLVRSVDGWELAAAVELTLPPSISALLSGRLERLPAAERAVVDRAAVIGREFPSRAVAELAPPSVAEALDGHLVALGRKDLVEPTADGRAEGPDFRFHHALLRDAAYDGLLKEVRAALHERYAGWLEDARGTAGAEQEEVVAFHLEQAHELREALGERDADVRRLGDAAAARLASAGRRALVRDDFAAAANLLGRALARASAPEPLVRFDRCTALLGAGDLDGAAAEVAALERMAQDDAGVGPVADVAAVATAHLREGAGRTEQHRLDRAIDALRHGGDPRVLAHALSWKGTYRVLSEGRHAEGEELLEEALGKAREAGDDRLVGDVLTLLPLVALWGPRPLADAEARCALVLQRLRERPGSRKMEAQVQCVQGLLAAMEGRFGDASALLAGARAAFTELGLALDLVDCDLFAARAALLAGEAAEAEAHARSALAGPGGLGASALAVLAQALAAQGAPEAEAVAADALAQVGPANLRPYVGAGGVQARLRAAAGAHADALAAARGIVAATGVTDAAVQHAEALETLAFVLRAGGDPGASAVAEEAREAYAAKGHAVGARRLAPGPS